jgi:homoserine kinase type II
MLGDVMMRLATDEQGQELFDVCEQRFGFRILGSEAIVRGWLNRKWKLTTTKGVYLLKSYHPDRYRLYNESALKRALHWQVELHTLGLLCPQILTHREEQLQVTASGQRFVVMTFCHGDRMVPGRASMQEMYSLGIATGQMHAALLSLGGVPTEATFFIPSVSERTNHWVQVLLAMETSGKQHLSPFAMRQLRATESFDIGAFEGAEIGWAHRDLWADNILVADDRLSAILDFDRVNRDYLELDVARAIISGALDGVAFNVPAARAFLDGYRTQRNFTVGRIVQSLRMLWYAESNSWITENMDTHTVPPQRFAHEMDWLARHLHQLPVMVSRC